jgi:hypothetical protein
MVTLVNSATTHIAQSVLRLLVYVPSANPDIGWKEPRSAIYVLLDIVQNVKAISGFVRSALPGTDCRGTFVNSVRLCTVQNVPIFLNNALNA